MATLINLAAAELVAAPGPLELLGVTGHESHYGYYYAVLKDIVSDLDFFRVRKTGDGLVIGPETVQPASVVCNDVGADWNVDRRYKRSMRLEMTEQRFELILDFNVWVDLEVLDRLLESSAYISVGPSPENGLERRYLLVQSRTAEHPKTHEATNGTRATYQFSAVPYIV